MRPIIRGPHPEEAGQKVIFRHYQDARNPLTGRLGAYCSYCEMPCPQGADVEHVQPKSMNPGLRLEWSNFLLACRHCNSAKGDQTVEPSEFVWPDSDNTFRAFFYANDRPPTAHPNLQDEALRRATKTIELLHLDRIPGHPLYSKKNRDTRWQQRTEAWGRARTALDRHQNAPDSQELVDQIVDTAHATGFWSIWMTVFADHLEIQRRLIDRFPGTAGIGVCFDQDCRPIKRPGGCV